MMRGRRGRKDAMQGIGGGADKWGGQDSDRLAYDVGGNTGRTQSKDPIGTFLPEGNRRQ